MMLGMKHQMLAAQQGERQERQERTHEALNDIEAHVEKLSWYVEINCYGFCLIAIH